MQVISQHSISVDDSEDYQPLKSKICAMFVIYCEFYLKLRRIQKDVKDILRIGAVEYCLMPHIRNIKD